MFCLGVIVALARDRVGLSDRAKLRVGEAVAVVVLEHHVLAELLRLPDLLDRPVVHRDRGRSLLGIDVDPAAGRRWRKVGVALCRALGHIVGIASVGRYREPRALGQARDGADEVARDVCVLAGIQKDLVDVPVGMVVGEDRSREVLPRTGGLQVVRRPANRVDRVVGVLAAVVVGVDPVRLPGGRHELHPSLGAGGRDVQVGSECRLDPVD